MSEDAGPLVEFFGGEGYHPFGKTGDYEQWSPQETAVYFLRQHLACKLPPVSPASRDTRQAEVAEWAIAAFGQAHVDSLPQRGIRLLEEAIELAQAAGCEREMCHRLVDHVFNNAPGDLKQEMGGVGLTLLALGYAAGISAEKAEKDELARVLAKPLAHFAARNRVKNDAGFNLEAPPQ